MTQPSFDRLDERRQRVSEHPDLAGIRSPLQIPVFRAVWIASLGSNFGGLIQSVGAAWMMTMLGGSPQEIALVQAATTVPFLLLALWAGAVADNLDRRMVMLAAQTMMFVLSAALAVAAWADLLSPQLLLAFTFAIACGTAVNMPAWQASVGDMVPRRLLPQAVAMNAMGFNIARSAGPAVGGAIVAAAGAAAAFTVNAATYIGLIAVLARWRPDLPKAPLPREKLWTAMWSGVRYVAMSPNICTVLLRGSIFGLGAASVPALLPIVVRDLVSGGALTYGLLFGSFGIGAVVAALCNAWLRRRATPEHLVRLGAGLVAMAAGLLSVSRFAPASAAVLAFAGFGWLLTLATFNVSVQLSSPRWVVARALALYQTATFGGMAAGSWLAGELTSDHSVSTALQVAAVLLALDAVLGVWLPLPPTPDAALDPMGGWRPPGTAIPINLQSGPIKISVEHRVGSSAIPDFLRAMHDRRRIRLRDGARHWSLLRDIADADLWIERFDFLTWLDYLRHNERRTTADAANQLALRKTRIDDAEPVVHRMIERFVNLSATGSEGNVVEQREPLTDPTRAT